MLTKDSFPLTNIFLCYQTLETRKIIFTQDFSSKQKSLHFTSLMFHTKQLKLIYRELLRLKGNISKQFKSNLLVRLTSTSDHQQMPPEVHKNRTS